MMHVFDRRERCLRLEVIKVAKRWQNMGLFQKNLVTFFAIK